MRWRELAVIGFVLFAPVHADIVTTEFGRRIEGTVVREADGIVEVRGRFADYRLLRSAVVKIEKRRLSWEEYAERATAVGNDVAQRLKLADWCEDLGLLAERNEQLEAVLRIDPDHAEVRRRLNYRRVGGTWIVDGPAWAREWRAVDARWLRRPAPADRLRDRARREAGEAWLDREGARAQLTDGVKRYLAAEGPARKLILTELEQAHAPIAAYESLVATLALAPEAEAGPAEFEFEIAAGGGRTTCFVQLPTGCGHGGTRHPLLLTMHTGSGDARARRDRFASLAQARGWIVAAPHSSPNFDRGWSSTEPERSVTVSALEALLRRYPVDPDRVILNGASMGGNGAWEIAMLHGDRLAGVAPWIAGPRVRNLPLVCNLGGLPLHARVGARENALMIESNQEAIGFLGEPATLSVEPDWHHVERPETWDAALFDWAELLRRDVYPPTLVHHFVGLSQGRRHWISAERVTGKPTDPTLGRIPVNPRADDAAQRAEYVKKGRTGCARIAARIEGQTVVIETRHVAKVEVLLSDRMLDLDLPVTIQLNGKTVSNSKIPRRLETLLEELARTRDAGRIYTARVTAPPQ